MTLDARCAPCRAVVGNLAGLVAETQALWAAEFSRAEAGAIGAGRGRVHEEPGVRNGVR